MQNELRAHDNLMHTIAMLMMVHCLENIRGKKRQSICPVLTWHSYGPSICFFIFATIQTEVILTRLMAGFQ